MRFHLYLSNFFSLKSPIIAHGHIANINAQKHTQKPIRVSVYDKIIYILLFSDFNIDICGQLAVPLMMHSYSIFTGSQTLSSNDSISDHGYGATAHYKITVWSLSFFTVPFKSNTPKSSQLCHIIKILGHCYCFFSDVFESYTLLSPQFNLTNLQLQSIYIVCKYIMPFL